MSLLPPNSLRHAGFYSAAFALLALCALVAACGDAAYSDDTPCQSDDACASDERCVLDDDTQGTCQPVSGANGEEEPAPANNGDRPSNNIQENNINGPVNNINPQPYRFVLLEDESLDNLNGSAPGADVDAIGLDIDGDQIIDAWASSVQDFNLGSENNEHIDTFEILGIPDSDCEARNFTSLGGNNGDNYIIVGFGRGDDVAFGSGVIILVWELGPTNCPNQTTWKDDEITVSISSFDGRETFLRIGTVGTGTNAVIIP